MQENESTPSENTEEILPPELLVPTGISYE
jgi:hypothetical protein